MIHDLYGLHKKQTAWYRKLANLLPYLSYLLILCITLCTSWFVKGSKSLSSIMLWWYNQTNGPDTCPGRYKFHRQCRNSSFNQKHASLLLIKHLHPELSTEWNHKDIILIVRYIIVIVWYCKNPNLHPLLNQIHVFRTGICNIQYILYQFIKTNIINQYVYIYISIIYIIYIYITCDISFFGSSGFQQKTIGFPPFHGAPLWWVVPRYAVRARRHRRRSNDPKAAAVLTTAAILG